MKYIDNNIDSDSNALNNDNSSDHVHNIWSHPCRWQAIFLENVVGRSLNWSHRWLTALTPVTSYGQLNQQ